LGEGRNGPAGDGIAAVADPHAPTVTNDQGGSQSHIPVRFDLIDAKALFEQAKVLHEGAVKYGEDNWRLISVEDHLNHLIMHAYAYLAGDRTDEHLSHAMCRAMFAQGVALQDPLKVIVQRREAELDAQNR
jgi:hypothetical protein